MFTLEIMSKTRDIDLRLPKEAKIVRGEFVVAGGLE